MDAPAIGDGLIFRGNGQRSLVYCDRNLPRDRSIIGVSGRENNIKLRRPHTRFHRAFLPGEGTAGVSAGQSALAECLPISNLGGGGPVAHGGSDLVDRQIPRLICDVVVSRHVCIAPHNLRGRYSNCPDICSRRVLAGSQDNAAHGIPRRQSAGLVRSL